MQEISFSIHMHLQRAFSPPPSFLLNPDMDSTADVLNVFVMSMKYSKMSGFYQL